MKPRNKYLVAALAIVLPAVFLMASSIKNTGVDSLTIYQGLAPDTFTDSVEVVLEGRLHPDVTFRATTVLAKCASRYENAPSANEYCAIREIPSAPVGTGA